MIHDYRIDEDLAEVIRAGIIRDPHRAGRSSSPACRIAKMLGFTDSWAYREIKRNGLDRIQSSLAWLCRYSNMIRGRK